MSRVVVEDKRGNKLKNISYDTEREKYYVTLSYPKKHKSEKRIKKVKTFKTLQEAKNCLTLFQAEKINKDIISPCDITLGEWLMQYLKDDIEPYKAKTTYAGYCVIAKKHIIPRLGNIKIQELTRLDIKRYYADKLESVNMKRPLSNNTVRKHHTFLYTALKEAVRCEIIKKNPAEHVPLPEFIKPSIPYYLPEQVHILLRAVESEWVLYPLVYLVCYLGLRREEALGLKWKDINFEEKTIYICRARVVANREIIDKQPKSESSNRTLHMNQELEEVLKSVRKKQRESIELLGDMYVDSGYVVVGQNGKPLNPGSVSAKFGKFIIINKELQHIHLHGLRHTFASILINNGVPIYYVSKIMGHHSTKITENTYAHLFHTTHKDILSSINYMDGTTKSDEETLVKNIMANVKN
ncbi:MAG: site-specific integrase [Herbinix sp.]|nr:site-specific integrase [Herbinix sp.]